MTQTIDGIFYDNMNAAYDAIAKKILARKVFLARIIKRCVRGFEDCSVKDIEGKYIEGDPEIGITPVSTDRTNAVRSIKGDNVEYRTLTEGETVFDIRTTVFAPKDNERVKIIINLEAQKKYNPGYSLIKRGMFHLSRLMSSEYNVEFTEPNFNDIKKVVSIWICMTAPKNESSIMDYSYAEKAVVGNVPKSSEEYDLMQLVMIYLGSDSAKDELLRLLNLGRVGKLKK